MKTPKEIIEEILSQSTIDDAGIDEGLRENVAIGHMEAKVENGITYYRLTEKGRAHAELMILKNANPERPEDIT